MASLEISRNGQVRATVALKKRRGEFMLGDSRLEYKISRTRGSIQIRKYFEPQNLETTNHALGEMRSLIVYAEISKSLLNIESSDANIENQYSLTEKLENTTKLVNSALETGLLCEYDTVVRFITFRLFDGVRAVVGEDTLIFHNRPKTVVINPPKTVVINPPVCIKIKSKKIVLNVTICDTCQEKLSIEFSRRKDDILRNSLTCLSCFQNPITNVA